MATADRWPMAMTMTMTIPTISPPSYYGVDGDMAKTPILCSFSKSSNDREWGRRRRGLVIFTTSTPIAEAAVAESKCRRRRRLSSTLTSWWWWVVAATTIQVLTHLPPSIAAAAFHFHPARSSRSNSHRRTILNSLSQSSPSPTTAALSFAQPPPPQILSDPYRIRRRRQRLSSLALFAIQTSTTSDSSSGISIADAKSDNTTLNLNDNQLFSSQQQILLPLQQLRHLQKYKTNKDIETAIVRLGRKGRTNEALQLYHAVWKLDELRQQHREDEREAKGQLKQQQQQLSQQLPPQQLSQELIQLINKSKLRPTTRLMNSAIDACARSSFSHHHHHHQKSTTESSTVLPPVAAIAQLPPRSRTRIALDIFHSGTSIWWESDDDETANTPFSSSSSSSASSDTMASLDATKKKRKKKHGGALSPNVYTFGALLACCARDGDISTSLELLSILEEGTQYPDVEMNDVIYSTVISACANANIMNSTISNDDLGGRSRSSSSSSIPNNVKVALDVLNRGIAKLYQRGDGRDDIDFDDDIGSSSSSTTTTTAKATTAGMMKMMGVVGYNAAISTMSRAGEWKLAVQLLGEMILYSSSSAAAADTTTTPSSSSTTTTSSSPLSTSLLLQRTNPNFAPMEMLRDDMNCRQLLLLPHHANINSTSSERTQIHHDHDTKKDGVIVPKPDEVTFGTVLAACERSGEWEILLNVAKAATEYGVKLDGMALTSVLHSCQQLGLAGE